VKITNRVRVLRKELGLRQEDLAKLAGVSRQTIIAIENEKYSPSLELAMSLSQLLSRPVEDIFQSLPDESD
jgi:putative transcriptional regulator